MEDTSAYRRAYEIICKRAGFDEIYVRPISHYNHAFNMLCKIDEHPYLIRINESNVFFCMPPKSKESIAKFFLDKAKTSDIALFDYLHGKDTTVLRKGQTLEQLIVEEDLAFEE